MVDAGGYGLTSSSTRSLLLLTAPKRLSMAFARTVAPKAEIEFINDWEGSNYTYCNEFLVHNGRPSTKTQRSTSRRWAIASCASATRRFIRCMSTRNTPNKAEYLIAVRSPEVHIHNMKLQSAARSASLDSGPRAQAYRSRCGLQVQAMLLSLRALVLMWSFLVAKP